MELQDVVPWGRSLAEYQAMFALSDADLSKRILGCGDGPASFNAEVTADSGHVVSVDPIYAFSAEQIRSRIADVAPAIQEQLSQYQADYLWDHFSSVDEVVRVRMHAMVKFLKDYTAGKRQGRYVEAALPELPFNDQHFELALCSHFLFLYTSQVSLEAHLAGVRELCRVAEEVRIYPLVSLEGVESAHLGPVMENLRAAGVRVERQPVDYRFQKGATDMLVLRSA